VKRSKQGTQRTNRCGAENPQNPTEGYIVSWKQTLLKQIQIFHGGNSKIQIFHGGNSTFINSLKHSPNYQGYCQSWQQQTGIELHR